jgi:hypothetical protein
MSAKPNYTWVLPRPRRNKYKGGFPLHFEQKLIKLLYKEHPKNLNIKILHPFGGCAEYGKRVDILSSTKPDYIGDAHDLNFIKSNSWDLVIVDPPYSNELSKELYGTGKLHYSKYISEAVRVCKIGGYIAMYHIVMTPRPDFTDLFCRIFVGTRVWHKPRICQVFSKRKIK